MRPLDAEINSLKDANELQILEKNVKSLSNFHSTRLVNSNENYLGIQHVCRNLELVSIFERI